MSERLDKVNLVKGTRWERMDPLDNQGVPTSVLIKDAIQEGKADLARDLADYFYFWEIKLARDATIDFMDGLPSFYMASYGEDALYEAHQVINQRNRGIAPLPSPAIPLQKPKVSQFEQAMHHAAEMARNNRMGKNDGVGGFTVEEYEDRYEVVWDPCYRSGRPRRGDPISGTPARSSPPYNYVKTQTPHFWTGGRVGIFADCVHCFIQHELNMINSTGYLGQWIVGWNDDPTKPCPYICYKDYDWIPEECYKRLGKVKPKVTSKLPKFKDVTRPIKVTHSDELPVKYQNTMRHLLKAFGSTDKAEQIRLVDILNAEAAFHHSYRAVAPRTSWRWMDIIVEKYGYNELYHAIRSIYSPFEPPVGGGTRLTKDMIPPAEERARRAAEWGRSERCGPNAEGSVRFIDEPDRIVMELDPCGSAGRALMSVDKLDDFTAGVLEDLQLTGIKRGPLTGPPMNLGVTTQSHPVAWGKVGIPHYCTRCCVQIEMAAVAAHGYLTTVVERPENATDPSCRWFFYKDLDDIPEEYYTRIGAIKPTPQP